MNEWVRILVRSWIFVFLIIVLLTAVVYLNTKADVSLHWNKLPERISFKTSDSSVTQRLPVSLEKYSDVWSMPLFATNRVPDAVSQKTMGALSIPVITNVKLTGIVIADKTRVAMISGPDNLSGRYYEGQSLPNGWVVIKIEERKIELGYGQAKKTLELSLLRLPITMQ